jgi:hypothetical protein
MREAISALAREHDRSMSAEIRYALSLYIASHRRRQEKAAA